jgi:hypothetical protein
MKISQLINDIVAVAEDKFGTTDHYNDAIAISIYPSSDCTWSAVLQRSTQKSLDAGEIYDEYLHTVKVGEYWRGFHTIRETLLEALLALQEQVESADSSDFCNK